MQDQTREPAKRRIELIVLLLSGALASAGSFLLAWSIIHLRSAAATQTASDNIFCLGPEQCLNFLQSHWAVAFGNIPWALFAGIFYFFLLLGGLRLRQRVPLWMAGVLSIGAMLAIEGGLYALFIMLVHFNALCYSCLAVHGCAAVLAVMILMRTKEYWAKDHRRGRLTMAAVLAFLPLLCVALYQHLMHHPAP